MGKETILIRTEWAEDLELLDNDEKADLLEMLFDYAEGGENAVNPNASRAAKMVFKSWRRFIDSCDEKYAEVCRKRSEAGKKGGAKAGNKNAKKNPIEQKQESFDSVQRAENNQNKQNEQMLDLLVLEQAKTSKTSLSDSDSDSEYDSVSVLDNNTPTAFSSSSIITNSADAQNPTTAPVETAVMNHALSQVVKYYQSKISPDMSRTTIEQIKAACEEWPVDVVLSAIDAAIDAGKRNGSYVCGILRGYRKDGIRTIQDVQRTQEAFRSDREQVRQKAVRNRPAGTGGYLPKDDIAYLFPELDENTV